MAGAKGCARLSAHVLKAAVLHLYTVCKLFPEGVVAELGSVQAWGLKQGVALKKLVAA